MMRMSGHIVYVNKEWYHGDIFFFVSFMLLGIKEIFLYPFLPKFDPFNFIIHVRTVRNEQNLYDSYRLLKRGFQRDNIPLAESRDSVSGGSGAKPHIKPLSAPQRVNFKIVQRTILKEETPCKRGRSLTAANFSTD